MSVTIKKGANKNTIAKLWEKLKELSSKSKGLDTDKFCGAVKFEKDGLTLQKEWRDEWE